MAETFASIIVTAQHISGERRLVVHNPTDYPLIGMGAQGAVFRISAEECVKIYQDPREAVFEREALEAAKGIAYFPRLLRSGPNYIVMEYIEGPSLETVLYQGQPLTERMAGQLLGILQEMRRLRFTRIDTRTEHILVSEGERLHVIDHIGAFLTTRQVPYLLLRSLEWVGALLPFLAYVAHHDPELYNEWCLKRKEGVDDIQGVPEIPPAALLPTK
ncbi:serine/threonine protein kinase [Paenibacillus caui]|uniref:serine/threonine protein kinase n=1 Tax=Paenibacillus caui TaxID=2873927 RepID=UPI001CA98E74|nr:serine/threonine protein kinase [Paenibacillus caui]